MPEFSVATWNVENLFLPEAGAEASYERKLTILASVLAEIDADVVALQEVGGDAPLSDLQERCDGRYPHRRVGVADGRGIAVAFLSKHPFLDEEDIIEFPGGPALAIHDLDEDGEMVPVDRMSRGALRVRVNAGGLRADVVTAHLKSKLLSYKRPGGRTAFAPRDEAERAQVGGIALMRRSAEAVTLRLKANALLEGNAATPLVMLGDFNDVPDAQTSLLIAGPSGSQVGTGGFDRPDRGDDARLFNLAELIAPERRYSRIHQGRGELLDQIFVSEEMLPFGPGVKRTLPELVDSKVDLADGLPSIGDDPNVRAEAVLPDHAPVFARFAF